MVRPESVQPRRFAGLPLDQPRLMGIVNVTPDSFSDGGETADTEAAVARGLAMAAAGADIVDVGGESSRPGALPVAPEVEQARVIPVVARLAASGVRVSVDTRRATVMAAALAAGASIVNDITALTGDPEALPLVARSGASVVLMHMQGEPRTMQQDPRYGDVVGEVRDWLADRVAACRAAGIGAGRIAIDPGIGFGKTVDHNIAILAGLSRLVDVGDAILIGVSRKSFIARLGVDAPPDGRLPGSIAAGLAAIAEGADVLRVHDVAPTRQAVAVFRAIGLSRLSSRQAAGAAV
jgi:dihydropteroate synthase